MSVNNGFPLASYGYDLNGNRTAKSLNNNTNAAYGYDDANRLLSVVHQNNAGTFSSFNYGYNSVGNRTFVERENGKGDVYGYDAIDQVTATLYEATNPSGTPSNPQGTDSFVYDPVGNRTNANGEGYTANNLNQYLTKGSTSLSYDANGNLSGSSPWTYAFDAQNRLLNANSATGESMTVSYDARNRPVKRVTGPAILPVSAVSRKTHGSAGTFDINLPLTGAAGIECRSGGASNAYQMVVNFPRAVSFNSVAVTTGTGSISNTATSSDGTQVTIDLTGVTNQQTIIVTLSGVTDGTVTNDVVVGMAVLIGDTNADRFVDSVDVSQVNSQSGHAINSSNFREDLNVDGFIDSIDVAFVKSKSGTALPTSPPLSQTPPTSYLIYDGWNLIAEFDASGNQIAKYYHGANTDEILERVGSPANVYYHHDALGSVTRLTNDGGNVVEQYSYSVFGSPTIFDSSHATRPSSQFNNRFMFTGREYFTGQGMYDYRNRVYLPALGRFLQTDSIRFDAGDINIYRYVKNNPITLVDPKGLCCEMEQQAVEQAQQTLDEAEHYGESAAARAAEAEGRFATTTATCVTATGTAIVLGWNPGGWVSGGIAVISCYAAYQNGQTSSQANDAFEDALGDIEQRRSELEDAQQALNDCINGNGGQ